MVDEKMAAAAWPGENPGWQLLLSLPCVLKFVTMAWTPQLGNSSHHSVQIVVEIKIV